MKVPILALIPLLLLTVAYFQKRRAILLVTNKRLIGKIGLIGGDLIDLPLSRVESVDVQQSLFERVANYGTTSICGTGGTKRRFNYVCDPKNFRRIANSVLIEREEPSPPARIKAAPAVVKASSATANAFCTECGNSLKITAKFCGGCGHRAD